MYLERGGARLLEGHAGRLLKNLPKAVVGEEEPVHQIRVASRRLRVFLPILASKPSGKEIKKLRKSLQNLVQAAGSSRDYDICVRLFDKYVDRNTGDAALIQRLRRRLVAARGRSRRKMAAALRAVNLHKLTSALKAALRRGPEDFFVAMARFRRARDEGAAKLLDAMAAAGEAFHPESLHKIRKTVRRMRYVAEVGAASRSEMTEAPAIFKKIQDDLGRIQDAHVLAVHLEAMAQRAAARGEVELPALAREMSKGYMDLSRGLHHAYLLANPLDRAYQALRLLGHRRTAA